MEDPTMPGEQALPGGAMSALWQAGKLLKLPAWLGQHQQLILTAPDLLA